MISKDQVNIGKAVAVILMFAHHIYGFYDRIPSNQELTSVILSKSIIVEHELGVFGKVCVGMFLFLSGLALGISQKRWTLYRTLERLLPFYSLYVANFIILISVSYWLVHSGEAIPHWSGINVSIKEFLVNLLIIRPSYSMEWWFARLYITIILLAWPMCEIVSRASPISLWILSYALFSVSWIVPSLDNFLFYQFIFTCGFITSRQMIPFSAPTVDSRWKLLILCISVFVISIFSRRLFGAAWEVILAPVCVWAAIWLPIQGIIRKFFILVGENSASMWLNHTFICYYWFNHTFYQLKYTPVLLSSLLFLSLLFALATNPLTSLIKKILSLAQISQGNQPLTNRN